MRYCGRQICRTGCAPPMNHVVVWSAMRSGSTEFAMDIARTYHLRYADELLNHALSKYNPNLLNTTDTRLVFKLFPMHRVQHLKGKHCIVVLERSPALRWCSLLRARETGDWTGHQRRGCTTEPPAWFKRQHRQWMQKAPHDHLYLTFEEVALRRAESLDAVKRHCALRALA